MRLHIISYIFAIFILTSCKTKFEEQTYRLNPWVKVNCEITQEEAREYIRNLEVKSVTIVNDSILVFYKRFGGLGSIIKVGYHIRGKNELITDSLNQEGNYIYGITNTQFKYNNDTLVNICTNELYLNTKLFKGPNKK